MQIMCVEVISKALIASDTIKPPNKLAVYLRRRVGLALQPRHTGAQQGCRAWMPNLRPVGGFIHWHKQVQALLHAPSRGASMDWIFKQSVEPPC